MTKVARSAANRYLWFREDSSSIWFRMAVPKTYRVLAGRALIAESLGTSDLREARLRAGKRRADLIEQWVAQSGLPPTSSVLVRTPSDAELEEAAVVLGYEMPRQRADTARQTLRGKGPHMYRAHVNFVRAELEDQIRATATGDREPVRDLANAALHALGSDLDRDSEAYAKLCDLLNAARLADLRQQHSLNMGQSHRAEPNELVDRVRARAAARANQGETLSELFEIWAAEMLAKRSKRPDTVEQDRKAITQFADYVGRDRAVDSITPLEVAEYRDTMRRLPPKWMSNKLLRDLDMRSAASKARELNLRQMAFTNVNKHLSTISPLYKWLAKQPRWAGLRNPTNGLFYDDVKGKNRRPSFRTEQLNAMFASPLFTGFLCDGQEHLPGSCRASDWRYWIPLICLFSGARVGEVAQLRLCDVRQERGVWFIHIRHEEAKGLSTKSGKSRPAAVHSMLERLGFLTFHRRQVEDAAGHPDAPLFPELAPNNRGQLSGTPSEWWRDYLVSIGIKNRNVEGGDGLGTHSFRHTLADRLRSEAELLDDQIEVCLGHNQKTTTAGYGELPQGTVSMFKGWMDAVAFEGVEFEHLIAMGDA